MARAFLVVLDSFGIGGAPDAQKYGDEGANTLGHIAKACMETTATSNNYRSELLALPNLDRLGLGAAASASSGEQIPGLDFAGEPEGLWGYATEISSGKDTPSGHWEIAGVPVLFEWGYFPDTEPCFPTDLVNTIKEQAELSNILGNKHSSGTEIITEFGSEHIRTGCPIFYTSADSVLQIAAHEEYFGLEKLYELCKICRKLVDPLNIGRVIARPFIGEDENSFKRTSNRKDFSVEPPEPTLLDRAEAEGRQVIAVGKISDIFSHRGITKSIRGGDNSSVWEATFESMKIANEGDLVFVNFVDFDMVFGHRRDVFGYASALEEFDRQIPELESRLGPDDLVIFTADHGCDPTWTGTDHTREQVPVLAFGPNIGYGPIGGRNSFADIGESVAVHLGLASGSYGKSFLGKGGNK